MKKILAFLFLLCTFISAFSASLSSEMIKDPFDSLENLEAFDFESRKTAFPDIEINLITAETGSPVYSYFGHTGLEVILDEERASLFFDYGNFSFSDGFYSKFIRGLLLYNVFLSNGDARISYFTADDRTVYRTPLNISTKMKNAVYQFLSYNIKEENNTYLYDYYQDNCSTRVRDIYNEATNNGFKAWAESIYRKTTLRREANKYLDKSPVISFTLNFLEGPSIDRPVSLYDECFLPETLMHAIEAYEEEESEVIHRSESRRSYRSLSLEASTLLFSVALYLTSLLFYSSRIKFFNRLMDIALSAIYIYLSVLSALLIAMMLFTNHSVTYFNANFLYANPLIIIMAAEAIKGKKINKRYYYSIASISILTPAFVLKGLLPHIFIQDNIPVLTLMASLYLINITRWHLKSGCNF